MQAYAPAGGVGHPPPDGTVVLLVLAAVCVVLVGGLLVRLRAGAASSAPRTRGGRPVVGVLDEDDVIAFGLALEACPDVMAHVLDEPHDQVCSSTVTSPSRGGGTCRSA